MKCPKCNGSGVFEQSKRIYPTSEDFIKSLKENEAYKHINIDRELGKMKAWLLLPKNKHRVLTRQFVINWLNKIDPPLNLVLPSSRNPSRPDILDKPIPTKEEWQKNKEKAAEAVKNLATRLGR